MLFPSQLISTNHDIILSKLNADDIKWVIQNTDAKLLENVFGSNDHIELGEFYKNEFSWTTVYIISNLKNDTYGIIRVVPEIDDMFSMHGIGWPNNYKFTRIYFKAWVGLHEYIFKSQSFLRSNCRDDNLSAINVLLKTGYEVSYLNLPSNELRQINFILKREIFFESSLFSMYKGIFFVPKQNVSKNNFKSICNHLIKKPKLNPNNKLSYIKDYNFNSKSIEVRKDLNVPKEIVRLELGCFNLTTLIIYFKNFRQIHIEFSGCLSPSQIMYCKTIWINQIKLTNSDLIFTYYENSNKQFINLLMLGNFIYRGKDSLRRCKIWSLC